MARIPRVRKRALEIRARLLAPRNASLTTDVITWQKRVTSRNWATILPSPSSFPPSRARARSSGAVSKRGKAWNEVDYTDNRVGREFGRALRNRTATLYYY